MSKSYIRMGKSRTPPQSHPRSGWRLRQRYLRRHFVKLPLLRKSGPMARGTQAGRREQKDSASEGDAQPADDLVEKFVDHLLEVTLVFVFLRSRLSGSSYESLNLLDREGPIFVGIHRLEDFFVSGLKFLQ